MIMKMIFGALAFVALLAINSEVTARGIPAAAGSTAPLSTDQSSDDSSSLEKSPGKGQWRW